jgi:hypothetical protein
MKGIPQDRHDRNLRGSVWVTRNVLMYFVLPLWLTAGFADYLCHHAAYIEHTSGVK